MSNDSTSKTKEPSNKWTYVPGRVYNITPLNVQDIRKFLEDSDDEEESEEEENAPNADVEEVLNTTFEAEVCEDKEPLDRSINNEKAAVVEEENHPSCLSPIPEERTIFVHQNKENSPPNHQTHKKPNDSFDLDFSSLSLHTPIKKVEKSFNYATPKINIIPPSETQQNKFITPQFKRPLFKTPAKPFSTPYSVTKKNSSILDDVKKPVIYQKDTNFSHLKVNEMEFVILKLLGKGGSAEVFSAFQVDENLEVAIKLVNLGESAEGYINEVKLLESLQHCDRIIKMYDYEIRDDKLIVVLERGDEDLSAILKQHSSSVNHLSAHMLHFYWMEMLYAVQQIHSNGVIHSDIKPANFLLWKGRLKLIDFGIASKVQEDMTCVFKNCQEGSCNYISPEALCQQGNGSPGLSNTQYKLHFKSDVWSLGCILYQLVYKKTPFQHINQLWAKLATITNKHHRISYPDADWVSPMIINTIKKCLLYDPRARPSVDELIREFEEFSNNWM